MAVPKIYKAAEMASLHTPLRPLVGTRKSAQSYVDRVTRHPMWKRLDTQAPDRVWVFEGDEDQGGEYQMSLTAILNGEELPAITVGYGEVNACLPALADQWVLLHELAHVITKDILDEGHHGKTFCYAYIALVSQFLGDQAGQQLVRWCKRLKIRLNYRLLLS